MGGLWEFPGGKQEAGESLEQCLVREIEEELGIEVAVGKHYLSVHHAYDSFWITLDVFTCLHLKGTPKRIAVDDFRWIELRELHRFSFPPADRKVLNFIESNPPFYQDGDSTKAHPES